MAAIAEPVVAEPAIDITDDRLAARNAVVLAVAQALAGGNNTVIVATTSIIASMLAPDPSLATLPISVMVAGMWMGTLPVGALSKAYGRRFALQVVEHQREFSARKNFRHVDRLRTIRLHGVFSSGETSVLSLARRTLASRGQ